MMRGHSRHWRRAALIALVLGGVAIEGTSHGFISRSAAARRPYEVSYVGVAKTARTPDEVASRVLAQIGNEGQIDSITVVASLGAVATFEGRGGPGRDLPAMGPIWIVRGQGVFIPRFLPPGVVAVPSPTGYYLVSDESGDLVGMGTPIGRWLHA